MSMQESPRTEWEETRDQILRGEQVIMPYGPNESAAWLGRVSTQESDANHDNDQIDAVNGADTKEGVEDGTR
jgi:hypothetical protein